MRVDVDQLRRQFGQVRRQLRVAQRAHEPLNRDRRLECRPAALSVRSVVPSGGDADAWQSEQTATPLARSERLRMDRARLTVVLVVLGLVLVVRVLLVRVRAPAGSGGMR